MGVVGVEKVWLVGTLVAAPDVVAVVAEEIHGLALDVEFGFG